MPDPVNRFAYTVNRELSWLKFNQRVLEEAMSPRNPVFERLKFLSIFTNNLDEFYMIRVGSLYDQTLLDNMPVDNKTGLTAKEQLQLIFAATAPLYAEKDLAFRAVSKSLESNGVTALSMDTMEDWERSYVEDYFALELQPLLSPQIINVRHPFPHLPNKRLYVAARLTNNKNSELYGLIPVPPALARVVFLPWS
jgi:polyphosphate kinase